MLVISLRPLSKWQIGKQTNAKRLTAKDDVDIVRYGFAGQLSGGRLNHVTVMSTMEWNLGPQLILHQRERHRSVQSLSRLRRWWTKLRRFCWLVQWWLFTSLIRIFFLLLFFFFCLEISIWLTFSFLRAPPPTPLSFSLVLKLNISRWIGQLRVEFLCWGENLGLPFFSSFSSFCSSASFLDKHFYDATSADEWFIIRGWSIQRLIERRFGSISLIGDFPLWYNTSRYYKDNDVRRLVETDWNDVETCSSGRRSRDRTRRMQRPVYRPVPSTWKQSTMSFESELQHWRPFHSIFIV